MSDITIYENLANAIILQAVKDYRMALKSLKQIRGTGRRRLKKPKSSGSSGRRGTRHLKVVMARC